MASYAFSVNPVIPGKQAGASAEELIGGLISGGSEKLRILPICDGKALVSALESGIWRLAWQGVEAAQGVERSQVVYLGEKDGVCFCALDVSPPAELRGSFSSPEAAKRFQSQEGSLGFLDLRTLMVAADWTNDEVMGELSIAGHARALLEWHKQVKFCGRCGSTTQPCDAGQRRRCSNSTCKTKHYPRIDPVVIMLVIDKERDRALLAHQPKYVPRMWSCLAGFLEPGESLEEAVKREAREETGVEVGEVVYHSSQPWPVGPISSMSCQLMMGFFAVAKTFDVVVDKKELEDARWHSREDVQRALANADYSKAQKETGSKVYETCAEGKEVSRGLSALNSVVRGDGIFVPGPYAIAHHLIATWASQGSAVLHSKI